MTKFIFRFTASMDPLIVRMLLLTLLALHELQTLYSKIIEDRGATAGDSTDDSPAIQCALLKASTNSTKVIIPSGVFIVNQTITMDDNYYDFMQIARMGWWSIIQHMGGFLCIYSRKWWLHIHLRELCSRIFIFNKIIQAHMALSCLSDTNRSLVDHMQNFLLFVSDSR